MNSDNQTRRGFMLKLGALASVIAAGGLAAAPGTFSSTKKAHLVNAKLVMIRGRSLLALRIKSEKYRFLSETALRRHFCNATKLITDKPESGGFFASCFIAFPFLLFMAL